MNPFLPKILKVSYECANENCFYDGALLSFEDVNFVQMWNSEIGDLDLIPHCPSCGEPMMIWSDNDGT